MTDLDTHARAGMKALNERKLDVAIQEFQAALALAPERPDMNSALGRAYLYRGEVHSAIPHLEAAVRLAEPYNAPEHQALKRDFQTTLATAYTLADRVGDARAELERAVATWPDSLETRMQLGSLLVNACLPREGAAVYHQVSEDMAFAPEIREAAGALAGALNAVLDDEELEGEVFLRAHAESYKGLFDEHAAELVPQGWYAEAARMVRGPDGEPKPLLAQGAQEWAMERVDLVNPQDGNVARVGDEKEPMVVAVNGLEPLAQIPAMIPWRGWPFAVFVGTRSPWHWLTIVIQLREPSPPRHRVALLDPVVGSWYLAGYNGDFGDADSGRFHYATQAEPVGDRALAWTFDLGRAAPDAARALLQRLVVLNDRVPIQRVLFGQGRLPD
jgi:thioredoxin-like negative regulator of GroEL